MTYPLGNVARTIFLLNSSWVSKVSDLRTFSYCCQIAEFAGLHLADEVADVGQSLASSVER